MTAGIRLSRMEGVTHGLQEGRTMKRALAVALFLSVISAPGALGGRLLSARRSGDFLFLRYAMR